MPVNIDDPLDNEWIKRSLRAAAVWAVAISTQTAVAQRAFNFPQDEVSSAGVEEEYKLPVTIWTPWLTPKQVVDEEWVPGITVEEDYSLPEPVIWQPLLQPWKSIDEEWVPATPIEEEYSLPRLTWQPLLQPQKAIDDELVPAPVPLNVEEEYNLPKLVWTPFTLIKPAPDEELVPIYVPLNIDEDPAYSRVILWHWFNKIPVWLFEQQDNVPRVLVPCPPISLIKKCPTTADTRAWTVDTRMKTADGACAIAPIETPTVDTLTFGTIEGAPAGPIISVECGPTTLATLAEPNILTGGDFYDGVQYYDGQTFYDGQLP